MKKDKINYSDLKKKKKKNSQKTKVQDQKPSQGNSTKHLKKVNTYPSQTVSEN